VVQIKPGSDKSFSSLLSAFGRQNLTAGASHGFGESFGIVLLEAMAASLPVVAFNISGYNDVVSNLNDGLLATPRDVHDLTEKLELLVTSAKLRRELGSNGLKKAKKYTWEIIAKRNIEYYKKLWENKK